MDFFINKLVGKNIVTVEKYYSVITGETLISRNSNYKWFKSLKFSKIFLNHSRIVNKRVTRNSRVGSSVIDFKMSDEN